MSTVTLETLRADFDAAVCQIVPARQEWALALCASQLAFQCGDLPRMAMVSQKLEALGEWLDRLERSIALYEIASSHESEKHGLDAAMLYKLSDGAVDPREVC
jgi:hypothetical protein